MKRMTYLALALAGLLGATASLPAQDTPAALAALREENEERFKTLNARIDKLTEDNEAYQKKINKLAIEVAKLKDEVERAKNDTLKDSIKRLEESIQDVDKRRIADHEKVLAEFAKLDKTLTLPPTSSAPPSRPQTNTAAPPRRPTGAEKGYEYTVKSGDTGGTILQFYRDQGVKITLRQLMEANPNVNWNKMKIGQKVFVPITDKP